MKRQMIQEISPEATFLDSVFDNAIVGVGNNDMGDIIVIYSQKECIDIISSDGVGDDDAVMLLGVFYEHSRGKYAPIFLTELWEMNGQCN